MSLATIQFIESISPIENFDNIELIKLTNLSYEIVSQKGLYKKDEMVIYVHIDTVLPDKPEFEGFRKYAKKRVKTAKIGNNDLGYVWSQGLILPMDLLSKWQDWEILLDGFEYDPMGNILWAEGSEVGDLLGITKYEPQISKSKLLGSAQNCKSNSLPYGIPKTDESNWQSLNRSLSLWVDTEYCDVTEKIDGTSFTAYYNLKEDKFGICGRNIEHFLDGDSCYSKIAKKYSLEEKLRQYCISENVSIALRGEIYGANIQGFKNNFYAKKPLDVAFYSVYNIDTHKQAFKGDYLYFLEVCTDLNLPTVKVLEENVLLTKDLINKYDKELEKINVNTQDHYFEGVVVNTPKGTFKIINKFYDMNK